MAERYAPGRVGFSDSQHTLQPSDCPPLFRDHIAPVTDEDLRAIIGGVLRSGPVDVEILDDDGVMSAVKGLLHTPRDNLVVPSTAAEALARLVAQRPLVQPKVMYRPASLAIVTVAERAFDDGLPTYRATGRFPDSVLAYRGAESISRGVANNVESTHTAASGDSFGIMLARFALDVQGMPKEMDSARPDEPDALHVQRAHRIARHLIDAFEKWGEAFHYT